MVCPANSTVGEAIALPPHYVLAPLICVSVQHQHRVAQWRRSIGDQVPSTISERRKRKAEEEDYRPL